MSPGRHALASAVLAAGTAVVTHDAAATAMVLVGGTVIDLDHLVDFFLNRSGKFTPNCFVQMCEQYRLTRFYLLMHSLEWILPFIAASFLLHWPLWVRGLALGLGLHMALDLWGNGIKTRAYLLSYRVARGFDSRDFILWLPKSGLEYWGSVRAFMKRRPEGPKSRRVRGGKKLYWW